MTKFKFTFFNPLTPTQSPPLSPTKQEVTKYAADRKNALPDLNSDINAFSSPRSNLRSPKSESPKDDLNSPDNNNDLESPKIPKI